MIQIRESLEIGLIETLRKKFTGSGLDDKDSLSYHQLMTVDGEPAGCARFYREGGAIVLDSIAVDPALAPGYREMLARSMVSRALQIGARRVIVRDSADFYPLLGFTYDGKQYAADSERIEFPGCCGERRDRN